MDRRGVANVTGGGEKSGSIGGSSRSSKRRDSNGRGRDGRAGRKAEAKREGLVNGLYISTPEFRRTFLRVLIKVLCVTVATVCNT